MQTPDVPPRGEPADAPSLASINRRLVADGETLPRVTLKDGSQVQTGTVAAMLHNVRLYNQGERGEVEHALAVCVPTLVKIGLFELFEPQSWISGGNPGRRFVGEKALEYLQRTAGGR